MRGHNPPVFSHDTQLSSPFEIELSGRKCLFHPVRPLLYEIVIL